MKDEGGFDDKQMNILIDISDSRVAFTTEKKRFFENFEFSLNNVQLIL